MNLSRTDRVYFIGAGGIGMSALARYFLSQGKAVAGYDRVSTVLTDHLVREGMDLHFEDQVEKIPGDFRDPKTTLVIYTPAIPASHSQINWFGERGFTLVKRAKALGEVFNEGRGIGVAGTHGKTSISTMVSHVLHGSDLGCNAFLGGISKNTGSNFYLDRDSSIVVAEADEFDRSFLTLYPEVAVLSSMDADHLDIYNTEENIRKGFEAYLAQIRSGGSLVLKHGLKPVLPAGVEVFSYALEDTRAHYYALNIEASGIGSRFDIQTPGELIQGIDMELPGLINVENAVAAAAAAHIMGVSPGHIAGGLSSYRGVERRFDVQVLSGDKIYIDDYAHHPTAIAAFLGSVRKLFPDRKLTGIFQPHLFSRTRDFAEGFAESLAMLDVLVLMDIYPAREEPIPGVTSSLIFDQVKLNEKYLVEREQVMKVLMEQEPTLLVTMGAGDIMQFVSPIKTWMETC